MDLNLGDTRLIIQTCKDRGLLRNQAAYVLATSYHESAHQMKPIKEMGGLAYLESKAYWPYFGRGYVQLTWRANYEFAGQKLGQDFVTHPELLLQAQYAAPILVIGMMEGWFTKGAHKLPDYCDLQSSDYVGARHIVNGSDQASLIAGYADTYEKLLLDIGYGVDSPTVAPAPVPQPVQPSSPPVLPESPSAPVQAPAAPSKASWLSVVADAIKWFIKTKYGQ